MAKTRCVDNSLWLSHIDDPAVRSRLETLPAGGLVGIRVQGAVEEFRKMKDGNAGPTPGLRPVNGSKGPWGALYRDHRGAIVEIEIVDEAPPTTPAAPALSAPPHWNAATAGERDAAWAAFMALTRAGWRSEDVDGEHDRDELHHR